jgi:hypothetical protein
MKTKLFYYFGNRYSLELEWNLFSEKYSLKFNNEDLKNVGSSNAIIVIELVSHSVNHPAKSETFHAVDTPGYGKRSPDFRGLTGLESDAYVRDRQLTLNATITLPSDENLKI